MLMDQDVNCSNFIALIGHLQKNYGDNGVQQAIDGLVDNEKYLVADKENPSKLIPIQKHHLNDSAYWVSHEFSLALFAKANKVVGGSNALIKAGEDAVSDYFSKSVLFISRISSTKFICKQATKLNARFNRTKTVKLAELTNNSAIFEFHYHPNFRIQKDICNWNLGIYRGLAKITGATDVKCEETKCAVDGDAHCVFHMTWRKKPNLFKRLLRWILKIISRDLVSDYEVTVKQRDQLIDSLSRSEERYRALIDQSLTGIFIHNNGRLMYVNVCMASMLNYPPEEMIGKDLWDFVHTDDRDMVKQRESARYNGVDAEKNYEFRALKKSGEPIRLEILATTINYAGQTTCMGNVIDITSKRQAEETLRESEEKYRRLVEYAPTGIYNIDFLHDKFTSINDAMITFSGYSKEELLSTPPSSLLTDTSKQLFFDRIKKASEGKKVPETVELEFITKDGSTRWVSLSTSYKFQDKKLIGASVIAQDITDRKQAEDALRKSEEKYRQLVESINDVIYSVDAKGTVTFVSTAVKAALGYDPSEIIGRNISEFIHKDDLSDVLNKFQKLLSGVMGPYEYRLISKSGKYHWVRSSSQPIYTGDRVIGIRGVFSDITESKELEEQLKQSYKMEAIGTLAGGIAHEFNNILGIILGNAELAIDDVPQWNPAKDCLKEIRSASLRAKDVVRQIMSFARKTPSERIPVQISTVIKESLKLLRATMPKTIRIQQELLCESELILANPTEISQILINLCTNSLHAMEDAAGVLHICLESIHLDDDSKGSYEGLKPGGHVKLTVKDTGTGIAPEIMDRIFDPYFTTKDVDKGLGMGLAVVYGIVKKNDGAITIASEDGKGTTVEVLFPIIEAQAKVEIAESEQLPFGTERILFVDDEVSLVKMVGQMLERLGYQVVGKTDSIQALAQFRSEPDRFDLVITDMAMPQMAGDRLVQELLEIRSDVPIILCTGHSDRIDEDRAKALGITAYYMKPLDQKKLANTVRKVLDETKGSTHSRLQP